MEERLPTKPRGLRLPLLKPQNTRKLTQGPDFRRGRFSSAQKNGLRYQKRVNKFFNSELEGYEEGVWWEYDDGVSSRVCQTDGIVYNRGNSGVTIIEIKYTHTADAWWQLRHLYQPVLEAWKQRPAFVNIVEVCRVFDPHILFPEPVELIDDLKEWIKEPHSTFGVFSWRG